MLDTILTILFFPLALFLPGYFVVSWFTDRQIARVGLRTIEALFLSVVLSSALTGIVALALAQAGHFSLPVLTMMLLLASSGIAGAVWLKQKSLLWHVAPSPNSEWVTVASVAIGAAVLFLRPHQYILGGGDAGVYVNIGANLAKTGALLIQEPLLAEIGSDLLPGLLREQPAGAAARFIRLPGFYLSDSVPDLVIPQFYALHPVWLGIGYSLFGLAGALLVTPVWGILSVVAIYLYGRTLFNWQSGWLAAVLLLITPLQIYFARYPTAEPITQFLSWTCLLAFTAFGQSRSPRGLWGLVAGVTFGQIFLARIDAVPMSLIPVGWVMVLLGRRRWDDSEWWFWPPLVGLTGYALFHGLTFSKPYVLGAYGWIVPLLWDRLWLIVAIGIVGGGFGFWLIKRWQRWGRPEIRRLPWERILRYGAAMVVVGLAVYAYFIRPRVGSTALVPYWYSGSQIPTVDHENFVRLGWYLSPLGIGLAVAGGVLCLLNERWGKLWPLWVVGGAFTVLYIHNVFSNPFHIYAMRRYVPVVVPFFVLAGAYAVSWLWQQAAWQKAGRLVSVVLLVTLIGWLAYNDRLVWDQVDYEGAVEQVRHVAGLFEDGAVVLFVDAAPVGLGAVLGTPLQFLYGITSFDLQEDRLDVDLLKEQITRWLDMGYPVYVVRNLNSPAPLFNECLVPAGAAQLDTPILEQTYDHVPSVIQRVHYELEIYWVEPACRLGGG
jgi:hypothetical protein